jgi:molybdate/tungstate transport system substrate-binding protein
MTRRELLARAARTGLALAAFPAYLQAADPAILSVAYAGSMGALMDGPLKRAVAQTLKLEMQGRAQGSNALAQLILGGSLCPDVFVPITPGPMLTVLRAGKADSAKSIARTEMVIAYSPKSRFASEFQSAAQGKAKCWEVLQQPGLRFGRTDPVTDPQGRNIIFTLMLAAKIYKQPGLVNKILGAEINEKQIFSEPTVQARLQSGELDASSAYKIQPGSFNLPYITLAPEINLSGEDVHAEHPDISLTLAGKTYYPEPLIFYAAALKDASNPKGAAAFLQWLTGAEAQGILRSHDYDAPGKAGALHA